MSIPRNIDTCLLCLDALSPPLQKPSSCNCNIYLHKKCMEDIQRNGLLCPICRIKDLVNCDETQQVRPNALMFLFFFIWFTFATCVACVILVGVSLILLTCLFFIELPNRFLHCVFTSLSR